MSNNDPDETLNLSSKRFLSLTGKTVAVSGLAFAGIAKAQTSPKPLKAKSPPARVPAKQQEPIKLEEWKSDAHPGSAPTTTPLAPDQRVGYAIVGLGHLSLEELLPALEICKKSRLAALVSGNPEKLKKVAEQYGVKPESCYSYQTFDNERIILKLTVIYNFAPSLAGT